MPFTLLSWEEYREQERLYIIEEEKAAISTMELGIGRPCRRRGVSRSIWEEHHQKDDCTLPAKMRQDRVRQRSG